MTNLNNDYNGLSAVKLILLSKPMLIEKTLYLGDEFKLDCICRSKNNLNDKKSYDYSEYIPKAAFLKLLCSLNLESYDENDYDWVLDLYYHDSEKISYHGNFNDSSTTNVLLQLFSLYE